MIDPQQLAALESQNGLPPGLLAAVMRAESNGNPNAVSPKGAQGLFQFMPETAQQYGIDPLDPEQAASGAARMYSDLSKQYSGDIPKMLAGYNWGSGNIQKHGMDNIPAETRDYIAKVTGLMQPQQMAGDTTTVTTPLSYQASAELPEGAVLIDNAPSDLPEGAVLLEPEKEKSNLRKSFEKRSANSQKYLERGSDGKPSALGTLNNIGNAAGFVFGDVPYEALASVAPEPVKQFGRELAASPLGRKVGSALSTIGEGRQYLEENFPKTYNTIGSLVNLAPLSPATKAVEVGGSALAKQAPRIGLSKAKKAATPDITNEILHKAMADKYNIEKERASQYWGTSRQNAVGLDVPDVDKLQTALPEIINTIESDPSHPTRGILPELKRWNDKLQGETMSIPVMDDVASSIKINDPATKFDLADAMDMKTAWNKYFDSRDFAQDPAYGRVASALNTSLESAAKANPTFGKSYGLAKKQWLNNVQNAFQNNPVLEKFFKPEDFNAYQSMASGLADRLPDATKKRMDAMVDNIKTRAELDAVQRVLPPAMGGWVARNVEKRIGKSTSRKQAAGKLVMGLGDIRPHGIARTAGNLADVVTGPEVKPGTERLIKAAKEKPQELKDYSIEYRDLLEEIEKEKLNKRRN